MSIGLHTTPIIVETLGDPATSVPVIIGETSRALDVLQTHTAPDTVVCSDATAHWIRDMVHLTAMPPVQVPGQSTPPSVYQILGLRPQQRPGAWRERQGLGPLVGRTHELATLHTALTQVEAGRGQVVGIVGEPGMGKSRLLSEFRHSLRGVQVTYLEGHCVSYGSTSPYLPVRDLLRQHCGMLDKDGPEAITAKLHTTLREVGLAPEEAAPYLLHLLGIPADTQPLAVLSPEAIRMRTFATLRQMSLHSSRQRPLILVVENLHWIDTTSEAYLTSLVEHLAGARLLLLTTYRPGYRPPWLAKSYATQMTLPALSLDDSRSLVQTVSPLVQRHTPLLHAILARAEGNPLFLEELARAALEPTPSSLVVPETIQGVLMARLDRLTETSRRFLQTASIFGRAISQTLLEACWDGPGDLDTHLHELQRLEFLSMQAEEDALYRFKHALTQEVAYESLPLRRRQALHATAGRLLEAHYADRLEEAAERLAYHYARSTETTPAVTYLSLCAEKAFRSHAHIEAVALLQAALEHAAHLPAEHREQRRLELALRQASSLSILGRFRDIFDLLLPHQEGVERLGDDRLSGPYYFRLGMTVSYLGNQELAAAHAQRAIEAAQRSADTVTLGQAYYLRLLISYTSGHYREAIASGRQAVTLLECVNMQHWHWLGMAQSLLSSSYGHIGEFASGLTAAHQVQAIGDKIGDPRLQSFAAVAAGLIWALQGEYTAGIAACQRGLERASDPSSTTIALGYLGHAYVESAAPIEAMPLLQQAVQQSRQLRFRTAEARFTPFLAEAYFLLGDLAQARDLAQQGLDLSREVQYGYSVGLAQRTLARVAQASGAWAEAEQHFQAALQTFTELEARFEVGRTHLSLAELARAQGQQDVVAASLQAAYHLFTTLQVPTYVERTASLAEAYGIPLRAADAGRQRADRTA